MAPLNILIIGNSIAGPALATFLLLSPEPASSKPRITLLERRSTPFATSQGQNIDIRGSGITLIRKLGLEKAILRSTTGEEGVQFVDADNKIWAQFKAGPNSGTSDVEIMRGRLAEILYERSKRVSEEVQAEGGSGIEYVFGDSLDEIDQDGEKVHVKFAKSGEKRSFDIVAGADGLQSQTRKMVWGREGEAERVKRLGMYGAFFSMPRDEKIDTNWRRWFHASGRRGIMIRPDQWRNRTTIFMTVINDKDKRLMDAAGKGHESSEAQKALMAEYFQNAGWECPRIVREMNATEDFYYDMVGQVKMEKLSKGRVVLLGDAGYCPSPISGMGTTLALNGAYRLAGALTQHSGDNTKGLDEYELRMRRLIDSAQKLPPGMPHLINPEAEWGVHMLHIIVGFMYWSGIIGLVSMLTTREPKATPVEDYGFKQLPELDI